ncbi:hypothetical protein WR25_09392 [Diploscapter pachys]|uniref:Protein zer-1 homolog-like C-terminal domain-containing protein n=1 Tax=Diploscapter pachys TaxID=2018661 RepID=A0A2A2KP02_9BILA|nr:hypothetical protein WR25_09392 [Diploscapter pachys]
MEQQCRYCRTAIPKSLKDLCASKLAKRISEGSPFLRENVPLPEELSNTIVKALEELNSLDSATLARLTSDIFTITRFNFAKCKIPLRQGAMKTTLKGCNLRSLILGKSGLHEESFLKFDFEHFVDNCLNEATLKSLKHLDLRGSEKIYGLKMLSEFLNLQYLSLANRPICHTDFSPLACHLAKLRHLDISNTLITDISALEELRNLEILLLHNVKIKSGDAGATLAKMRNLRVLDISRKLDDDHNFDYGSQEATIDLPASFLNEQLSKDGQPTWPHLNCLDLSGQALGLSGLDKSVELLNQIVDANKKLEIVGILGTPLNDQQYERPGRKLKVISCSSRRQVMDALAYYTNLDRESFTSFALHSLYYALQSAYDEFEHAELRECADLVCDAMKKGIRAIPTQMAGSACLYHLCKMTRIQRLPERCVRLCVESCLDAAEQYRNVPQLQKNVWLTLCNDFLLRMPGMDFYRTCKTALDSMMSNRDPSVSRMTIAIVSIVTPKMRSAEAKLLISEVRYIRHLVQIMEEHSAMIIKHRRHENSIYTLKFTLSALWNLTDDCPKTCVEFFNANGVVTAFEILEKFDKQMNISTKVLGILNNVAEVDELKSHIMQNKEYIAILLDCLDGDFDECDASGRHRDVERGYFAAGVLSNLLLCNDWTQCAFTKEMINAQLVESIQKWPRLDAPMVSYRSFAPFMNILKDSDHDGAQMWCLWGVLHVLENNDKQPNNNTGVTYLDMLKSPRLPEILLKMHAHRNTHIYVKYLIQEIWMISHSAVDWTSMLKNIKVSDLSPDLETMQKIQTPPIENAGAQAPPTNYCGKIQTNNT